ncbi:MAG TPA: hypothetical protein VH369_14250 [Bryobacteraceae bacterium]
MLRALSSSLLSLLLVLTLVWGGCISCEQYFTFGTSHGCCNPDGHCKTKTHDQNSRGRDCKQIAFEHQKGIDLHFDLPMVAVERVALPLCSMEVLPRRQDSLVVDPSPPDLQALHSTFLI